MELSAQIINTLGLLLDIAGALMLWKYGLPESINRSGEQAITIEQVDEAEIAKAKHYDKMSKIGLTLLIGGFLLQIYSTWI